MIEIPVWLYYLMCFLSGSGAGALIHMLIDLWVGQR